MFSIVCFVLGSLCAPAPVAARTFHSTQTLIQRNGADNVRPDRVFGVEYSISSIGSGIAHITFFAGDELPDDPNRNITVGVSLAVTPLLGSKLAQLIAIRSNHYDAAFVSTIIGAFGSAGLSMTALLFFYRADVSEVDSVIDGEYMRDYAAGFREYFLGALFQVIFPMTLPAVGAAAGYTLGTNKLPGGVNISFCTPTLFQSATGNRDFVLGVQLVNMQF